MNYTYADTGIVTSDPQIACMFLGEFLTDYERLSAVFEESRFQLDYADRGPIYPSEITIPYPLIREGIKPVVGEQYFSVSLFEIEHTPVSLGNDEVRLNACWGKHEPNIYYYGFVSINEITKNKTPAQLRDLIARTEAKAEENV